MMSKTASLQTGWILFAALIVWSSNHAVTAFTSSRCDSVRSHSSLQSFLPANPFGNLVRDSSTTTATADPDTLIELAQDFVQNNMGLQNTDLLADNFVWIHPSNVETGLSKTDYIAAGRFFNLQSTFPDLDYRGYDYRLCNNDKNTVRLTCRVSGTMRGDLRLRDAYYSANGKVMQCPPEGVSITFDSQNNKVTKLVSGVCLDRLVGNTDGWTGVDAAAVFAGQPSSVWDRLPVWTVLGNLLARPARTVPERSTFLAPFPETVMIQLAKGLLGTNMAYDDPSLLSDETFDFVTPSVGPIRKEQFLKEYAAVELDGYNPNPSNFRVDPYDPFRVWVDLEPTSTTNSVNFVGHPQAMSLSFDQDGYCTRITSSAVLDPSVGDGGGLGGPEGYKYAMGRASVGIATRPLPKLFGRLRKRFFSVFTGVGVDEYGVSSEAPRKRATPSPPSKPDDQSVVDRLNGLTSSVSINLPKAPSPPKVQKAMPATKTPFRPKPIVPKSVSKKVTPKKVAPKPKPAPKLKDDPAVVSRLEKLKDLTSSIRIVPPDLSKSFSLQNPVTPPSNTVQTTKQQQLAAQRQKQQQAAAAKQKQQAAARQASAQKAETARKQNEAAAALAQQQRQRQELAAARQAEVARKQKEAAAARAQMEQERAKQTAAKQAEAERRKQEAEAKRAEALRVKEEDARKREAAAKATLAEVKARAADRTGPPKREERKLPLSGIASATINLFGRGKAELDELPEANPPPIPKRVPFGVPTLSRWRQNGDNSITGLVKGSRSFDDGSRITTSPITSGTVAGGEVVKTGSGSRYYLE